ncbi:site-specific DNA-methyltransferase [Pasteurella multocida]|uniref:site-specific DNA-methyltransferase n=1 Tax=Pasteurella multocida TaxID=747 RepID=UPI00193B7479|nr:site-specific DNA-methyltransferase [Pasteurella multocida]MBM2609433.1 site-specific DNA-methyltransferase [Pasteurella multocida]
MSKELKMHTNNLVAKNIEKLTALFPNCITETQNAEGKIIKGVDFDLLRQELSETIIEGDKERYRLDWVGKKEAILTANAPIAKTLRPCREESVNFDTTQNLFIEGDNLDALKLLQETYLGKVKMIYIDPPYNTGNDFIYNDDFAETVDDFLARSNQVDEEGNRLVTNTESNGRFHSAWLSMMYSRLKLARNLLTNDGVILVSIGNDENANTLKLLYEIFSEQGFVTTLHVEMSATQGMKVKAAKEGNIVKNGEYIHIFSKNGKKNIAKNVLYDYRPKYDTHYSEYLNENSEVEKLIDVYKKHLKENNISDPFINQNTQLSELYDTSKLFSNFVKNNTSKIFRFDKVTGFNKNEIPINKVIKITRNNREYTLYNNNNRVSQLLFLNNSFGLCDDFEKSFGLRKIRGDWWKEFYKDMGNVSKEGNITFSNGKKPVRLIQQLIKMITDENDIVMDFFAGSGTTAHAVNLQNLIDVGQRKYILVQLAEELNNRVDSQKNSHAFCVENSLKPFVSEITKERIRRAGNKILADNAGKEGIKQLDIGFRVLKIDSSNMKEVYYTPDNLSQTLLDHMESNIKEDRSAEDLLFQVMLDWGIELSLPIEQKSVGNSILYYVGGNSLVACFDALTLDVINEIAKHQPLRVVSCESAIQHDQDKTNIKERFKQLSPETDVRFL